VAGARIARLATVSPGGRPHIVPVCYALVGDAIVTAIDAKPKSTRQLRRLANLRSRPEAALLVDHYAEDWTRLWWVRVDGRAEIVDRDAAARDALAAKYPQYVAEPPEGPFVYLRPFGWTGWRP